MGRGLLVVDVQNGFINQFTEHIPARLATLINRQEYDLILFTRFVNTPDGPYHRFLDWYGCTEESETELAPEVAALADPTRVYTKSGHTGLSERLAEDIRASGFEEFAIVGIDTDMCVLKVAMDVFDLGIRPIILTDCCASTAGLQAHLAGLAILARNIGANQLRDDGMNGGWLGAPPARSDATRSTAATT